MEPLISIVVPVYNVEAFLKACLDNLSHQTYRNIEVILVDDGSTDASGQICDIYAMEDSRFKVVHKQNGGQSEARNIGIDYANGEYLAFVDSDDCVAEDYIAYLHQLIVKEEAEISVCRYKSVRKIDLQFDKTQDHMLRCFDARDAIESLCYQRELSFAVYCMLIRRDLFNGIRFPVGMIYEEMDVIPSLFMRAHKIVFGAGVKYHYLQRTGSTVRAAFSPRKMDYVKNTERMMCHVGKVFPELQKAAQSRFLWANLHVFVQMTDRNSDLYKAVHCNIKKYRWDALRDPKVRMENKLLLILSLGGNRLIRAMYRMRTVIAALAGQKATHARSNI